jgi:hypothetical protein
MGFVRRRDVKRYLYKRFDDVEEVCGEGGGD